MKNQWLEELRTRLQEESSRPDGVGFDRLRELGMINERGEVTGHLRRWDAFLAITQVRRANGAEKIDMFRCLKPAFGMPGGATIDVRRNSIVEYLKQGKKIITACKDDRLGIWKEGAEVRLTPTGFIRIDSTSEVEDSVGNLPQFTQTNSGL